MRKWIVALLLLAACTNQAKIPADVIQGEQWKLVLWDMIQAERFAQQFIRDTAMSVREQKKFELYGQVFAIHGISKEEFISSMKFYLKRPDLSSVVFDSLAAYGDRLKIQSYEQRGDTTARP